MLYLDCMCKNDKGHGDNCYGKGGNNVDININLNVNMTPT